jgi:hypothetical protein
VSLQDVVDGRVEVVANLVNTGGAFEKQTKTGRERETQGLRLSPRTQEAEEETDRRHRWGRRGW